MELWWLLRERGDIGLLLILVLFEQEVSLFEFGVARLDLMMLVLNATILLKDCSIYRLLMSTSIFWETIEATNIIFIVDQITLRSSTNFRFVVKRAHNRLLFRIWRRLHWSLIAQDIFAFLTHGAAILAHQRWATLNIASLFLLLSLRSWLCLHTHILWIWITLCRTLFHLNFQKVFILFEGTASYIFDLYTTSWLSIRIIKVSFGLIEPLLSNGASLHLSITHRLHVVIFESSRHISILLLLGACTVPSTQQCRFWNFLIFFLV